MDILTAEQKELYIANRGMNCPICEADNIQNNEHDFDDNLVYVYNNCFECGARWTDVYRLVDVCIDENE